MTLNVCLIGAGWAANAVHGPSLVDYRRRRRGIRLFGICDRDAVRMNQVRERFGFQHGFDSVEDMARTGQMHAAIVAVNVEQTSRITQILLDYNVPMLIEKPPAMTRRAAMALANAIGRKNGRVMVGFNRRYAPVLQRLKSEAADIGTIQIARGLQLRPARADADFSTTAIHAIDALRWLCDDDYASLDIRYGSCGSQGQSGTFHIQGQMSRGAIVELTVVPQAGRTAETYTLHAAGQTLTAELGIGGAGQVTVYHADKVRTPAVRTPSSARHDQDGFYQEVAAFLNAVRADKPLPGPSVRECVQSVAVMEALATRRRRYSSAPLKM